MKHGLKFFDYGIAALILVAGFLIAFAPNEARAERPSASNPLSYIGQLGQMGFAQGGGVFLPTAVLQSLGNGNISPIMQYVLVNTMFNQCLKDIKKYTPGQRDPFAVAKSKYTYGICRLNRCIQQGMLVLALPLLADDAEAGGSGFASALAQGFQNESSCGGQGPAIDPMLIQLLSQN